MNFEALRRDKFQGGFDERLRQMIIKTAYQPHVKQAGALGRALSRILPRLEQAAPVAGANIVGRAGQLTGGLAGLPVGAARVLGTQALGSGGALSRFVGGAGQGFLSQFGAAGARLGRKFNQLATSNVRFGPRPTSTAAGTKAGPAAGGAAPAAPAAAPTTAPGAVGGGAAPGTVPNTALGETGLVPTNRGFTMPGAGKVGPGVDPSVVGDPTGGLLHRIRGSLPPGVQNWMAANPNLLSAAGGALAGGGAMYGLDAYGDSRRRKALENLGMMQRLGLAFQLATNPQGFAQTLRL